MHDDIVFALAKGAEILEGIVMGPYVLIEGIRNFGADQVAAIRTLRNGIAK